MKPQVQTDHRENPWDMRAAITRLETDMAEVKDRLDRIETRLGSLEEKVDAVLRCLQDRL